MRYAVLESGGKQYIAREGQAIEVDRLPLETGKPVEFDDVLLLVDDDEVKVGRPRVEGGRVTGTVVGHIKGEKVIVFKYIPKERYRRKRGHRQQYTRVAIESIGLPGARKVSAAAEPEPAGARRQAVKPKPAAKKAAAKKTASKTPAAKKTAAKAPAKPKKPAKN